MGYPLRDSGLRRAASNYQVILRDSLTIISLKNDVNRVLSYRGNLLISIEKGNGSHWNEQLTLWGFLAYLADTKASIR